MTGIYKITSPTNKIYIGQAIDIFKRLKSYDKTDCKRQPRLYNSLKYYGFENHNFEIIELCGEFDLNYFERKWQDFYNVTSNKGLNCKLQFTNDKSGTLSKETKIKISNSRKGFKHSEETKLKIKSYKHTEFFCQRRSEVTRGSNNPRSKKLICTKTNKIYNCAKEALIDFNISYSTLIRYLKNKLPNKTTLIYYNHD